MSTTLQFDVILAAGGNPTGIICYDDKSHRDQYKPISDAAYVADKDSSQPIEQFGFIEGLSHLQMSGGEFCGNASRAAAFLLAEKTGRQNGTFTISGFPGTVEYAVDGETVRCVFPRYPFTIEQVNVLGVEATYVDLGGIVHVVLPPTVPFRNDPKYYKVAHTEIVEALKLQDKAAVGVIWQQVTDDSVAINPVVRVLGNGVETFYYETSCGSGTLATLIVHGEAKMNIVQPTGQAILAEMTDGNTLTLTSKVGRRK